MRTYSAYTGSRYVSLDMSRGDRPLIIATKNLLEGFYLLLLLILRHIWRLGNRHSVVVDISHSILMRISSLTVAAPRYNIFIEQLIESPR